MELRGTNARLQEEIDNLKVSEDFILLCLFVLHKLEFCEADKSTRPGHLGHITIHWQNLFYLDIFLIN